MVGIGALIWLGGMLLGLFEVGFWLKNGYWANYTLLTVTGSSPLSSWHGLNQVLYWVWTQPLWAVAAGLGMVVLFLATVDSR